jgi:predicted molibdopterin-dependent oxidoreductase YjgC
VPELANHSTRLLQPQKTVGATYFPITWDEAIGETVNRLAACPPGGFSLSISASSSNEDLYIAQKFTRVVMHSNAIHTPEGEALGDGLGAVVHLLKRTSPLSCLETASTILCVGLDGRFSQSVIEVALHRAQRRGAKLIALYPGLNSLSDHADIWLKPGPEGEAAVLERLVNLVSLQQTHPLSAGADSGNADSGGAEPDLVEAAQTLASTLAPDFLVSPAPFIPHPRRSFILPSTPVILVGPAILASKDNRRCLAGLERLADQLSARVIVLPAQGNLVGSFLMGAYPELLPGVKAFADQAERDKIGRRWGNPIPGYFPGEGPAGIKVLFCIGASPQAGGDPPPFTIYQNILLPPAGSPADLMLPAAAFSECRGTSIDYAGQVREFQRAVAPHGESRPSWQILCTLARAMGAAGFDFGSEAEIQAEIAGLIDGFAVDRVLDLSGLATVTLAEQPDRPRPTTQQSEHLYMGFPLAVCVEGLRALYPEEAYGCGSP